MECWDNAMRAELSTTSDLLQALLLEPVVCSMPLGVNDMKQFTRCTNCHQWYTPSATTTVEIVQGSSLCRTTVWCWPCIQDAEHRSQAAGETVTSGALGPEGTLHAAHATGSEVHPADFRQLVHEHFGLMERALHEDETTLVPLIDAFMQRCHTYQTHLKEPALAQRLTGHLQYWQAFLQALQQSR
jgi:hypothetical protein